METAKQVCAICGTTEQLLRCAKCKTVYYCSTSHQHSDWPHHKQECRRLAKNKDSNKQLQQLQHAVAAASLTGSPPNLKAPTQHDSVVTNRNFAGLYRAQRDKSDNDKLISRSNILDSMQFTLGTNENEILNTQAESVSSGNSNGVGGIYIRNYALQSTTRENMNNCNNMIESSSMSHSEEPIDECKQQSHNIFHAAIMKQNQDERQEEKQQQQQEQPHQPFKYNHLTNHNRPNEKTISHQIGRGDENVIGNVNERRYEELCRIIINDMNQYGLSVLDDFLGMEKGLDILNEVHQMYATGLFKDGQLVSKSIAEQDLRTIRGDKIAWVKGIERGCASIGYLINQIDAVICRANTMKNNGILGKYNIKERTKAMVACYPGSGAHYVMHVDNPNRDGRVITAIYYLNMNWDASASGGMLRVFPEHGGSVADIEPKFDRLIFFWSDMRNPHEVQPAHRTRYAITVWYFDANEREAALNRWKDNKSSKTSGSNITKPANENIIKTTTTTAATTATVGITTNGAAMNAAATTTTPTQTPAPASTKASTTTTTTETVVTENLTTTLATAANDTCT